LNQSDTSRSCLSVIALNLDLSALPICSKRGTL
jgi:hypothetical protein